MTHIFLDFEMTPIPKKNKEARAIAAREIIQIGAVKLSDDYEVTGRYCHFVKPELSSVNPKITQLTGITDADVADASTLETVLADFADWIGLAPVRIYSWSGSDKKQIRQECALKKLILPRVFRRWMDFQRIYTRLLGLSRRSKLSLTNAIGSVESAFEGQQHSALSDAENAASLLMLVKDRDAFERRSKIVRELMGKQSTHATTLGDLFGDVFSQYIETPADEAEKSLSYAEK